jgi:hypothetical protein
MAWAVSRRAPHVLEQIPPTIVVSSTFDFRNRMVLKHYAPTLPSGERIRYFSNALMPLDSLKWLFVGHADNDRVLPDELSDTAGIDTESIAASCIGRCRAGTGTCIAAFTEACAGQPTSLSLVISCENHTSGAPI